MLVITCAADAPVPMMPTFLPFKLTHVQYILLEGISWINKQQEDIVTQAKLAETLEVDVMMTSVVIRSLLEKELIHREPHPRDTRAHQLVLTERGASLLKDAVRAVDSFENGFFETISTDIFQQKLSSILEGS